MINIHKLLSIPRSLYFNIKWFGVWKSLAGGGTNSNFKFYKS